VERGSPNDLWGSRKIETTALTASSMGAGIKRLGHNRAMTSKQGYCTKARCVCCAKSGRLSETVSKLGNQQKK